MHLPAVAADMATAIKKDKKTAVVGMAIIINKTAIKALTGTVKVAAAEKDMAAVADMMHKALRF
jgi:hypothetical protein